MMYTNYVLPSELQKTKALPTKSEGLNRVPLGVLLCVSVLKRSGPIDKRRRELDYKA